MVAVQRGAPTRLVDRIAVEEPLEVRLAHHRDGELVEQSVAVTMRTPGRDRELAVGFLFTEGILRETAWLEGVGKPGRQTRECNIVRVQLRPEARFDATRLVRNFYTTSSCGVCSKASLEALRIIGCQPLQPTVPIVPEERLRRLPARLRRAQSIFAQTGGLHAAALFDSNAELITLHEDVGRHNAVDKVIGERFLLGELPLSESLLMVSGRSSFEILQKALAAGIPVVAAVGAPSSLAVALARQYQMTLLGFVRRDRFNIYAGFERIAHAETRPGAQT